jgi:hypothetical protein
MHGNDGGNPLEEDLRWVNAVHIRLSCESDGQALAAAKVQASLQKLDTHLGPSDPRRYNLALEEVAGQPSRGGLCPVNNAHCLTRKVSPDHYY